MINLKIDQLTSRQNAAISRIIRSTCKNWQKQVYCDGGKTCATNGVHAIRLNTQSPNQWTDIFTELFCKFRADYTCDNFCEKFEPIKLSTNVMNTIRSHRFRNHVWMKRGKAVTIARTHGDDILFDCALLKNVFEAIGYPSDFGCTHKAEHHCEFFLQADEKFPVAYVRSDIGDALIMPLNPRYL